MYSVNVSTMFIKKTISVAIKTFDRLIIIPIKLQLIINVTIVMILRLVTVEMMIMSIISSMIVIIRKLSILICAKIVCASSNSKKMMNKSEGKQSNRHYSSNMGILE